MRIPPLIYCPMCDPGPKFYAGKVLPIMCALCRSAIKAAHERGKANG